MFNFAIKLPDQIEAGTFYHTGKTLSAKITYKIQIKVLDEIRDEKEGEYRSFKEHVFVKVNKHIKCMRLNRVLYDEALVTSFLCFGGGTTTVQGEFKRDTYCVTFDKLRPVFEGNDTRNSLSMSLIN
jgi:hypothetical protein